MAGELVDRTVEIFHSGAWEDVSSDALNRDPVSISRGIANEGGSADPGTLGLSLWNGTSHVDGSVSARYAQRNPLSDLYGLIGPNLPIRLSAGLEGSTPVIRMVGETVALPPRWDLSGRNRWVPVEAAGVLRRLGIPSSPLPSVLRRHITGSNVSPVAYWALDGGSLLTAGQLTTGSGTTMRPLSGRVKFSAGDLAPWLEPGVVMDTNSTMLGNVAGMSTSPDQVLVTHMRRADDGGSGPSVIDIRGNTEDGGNHWIVTFTPPDTVEIQLNHDGAFVFSDSTTDETVFDGDPHEVLVAAFSVGGDVSWRVSVDGAVVLDGTELSQDLTGVGQVRLSYNPGSGGNQMAFSHVAVWDESLSGLTPAAFGWDAETAAFRVLRICAENDVAFTLTGDSADSPRMGPQLLGTFLDILQDCAKLEAAGSPAPILTEQRDGLGLHYRTLRSLYAVS